MEQLTIVEGELKMARVLDLSAVESYKAKVVLAYLEPEEGAEIQFDPACVFEVYNPVKVATDEMGEDVIGHANVYTDGKRLLADLFLTRDCPQRLDIETGAKKLYPVTSFELLASCGGADGPTIATKLQVILIYLSDYAPDTKIGAVGEPVL